MTKTGGAKCEIALTVNGEPKTVRAYPMERLLDVLRQQLGLTGTKEGCGEGECGACSVMMDGALVDSCLVPVLQAQGAKVVTIEGLGAGRASMRAAGNVSGIWRRAMRHLHAGNDSRGRSSVARKARAHDGRYSAGSCGQSLPLHRVRADLRSGGRGGAARCFKMRSDPAEYDLVAPANLQAAVGLLASSGSDRLASYRRRHGPDGAVRCGRAASAQTGEHCAHSGIAADRDSRGRNSDWRRLHVHRYCASTIPCSANFRCSRRAANWTGGIANQNRGTLGGNIVNASPAADSLPALLAYDAELILVSVRGERRVPYSTFHTGYKKMTLAADELIRAVCVPQAIWRIYFARAKGRNAQRASRFEGLHGGVGASGERKNRTTRVSRSAA